MSRFSMAILCGLALVYPLHAGIFGNKQKPTAAQVAEWVHLVLNHPDASKRAKAAEALADVDAAQHPEVLQALVEALRKDASILVRRTAANSLGKLKPPSLEAAEALDQAIKHDESWSVRWSARWARLGYHVPRKDRRLEAATIPPSVTPSNRRTDSAMAQPSVTPTGVRPLPLAPSTPGAKPAVPEIAPGSEIVTPPPGLFPPHPRTLELAPPPRVQPSRNAESKLPTSSPSEDIPPASLQLPGKPVRSPDTSAPDSGPILVPPQ